MRTTKSCISSVAKNQWFSDIYETVILKDKSLLFRFFFPIFCLVNSARIRRLKQILLGPEFISCEVVPRRTWQSRDNTTTKKVIFSLLANLGGFLNGILERFMWSDRSRKCIDVKRALYRVTQQFLKLTQLYLLVVSFGHPVFHFINSEKPLTYFVVV